MSKQPLVYLSGSLTVLSDERRKQLHELYEQLAATCEAQGFRAYLPHKWGDPFYHKERTPTEIDRHDRLAVTLSYLMIAYVGEPSLGVGIEVEMAYHANVPVVLVYEKEKGGNRLVSRLVRGNPAVVEEISFTDSDDCVQQVGTYLGTFKQKIAEENLPDPLSI